MPKYQHSYSTKAIKPLVNVNETIIHVRRLSASCFRRLLFEPCSGGVCCFFRTCTCCVPIIVNRDTKLQTPSSFIRHANRPTVISDIEHAVGGWRLEAGGWRLEAGTSLEHWLELEVRTLKKSCTVCTVSNFE